MKFYKHKSSGNVYAEYQIEKNTLHEYDEVSETESFHLNIEMSEQHLSRISRKINDIHGIIVFTFILSIIAAAITFLT